MEKGKKLLIRKAQEKTFLVSDGCFLDDEEDEDWIQCQKCRKWFYDMFGVYG